MAQKKLKRYRINWNGKSINAAMAFFGLSFFLRMVYFFGCVRIENVGFWEFFSWLILPALLEAAFIVLLRVLRWDTPKLYSLMSAGFGLILIFQSFGYGSVVRTVLAILVYLGCSVLVIGVAGGYLSKQIGEAAYLLAAAGRLLIFELVPYVFNLRVVALVKDLSGLFVLLALMCLVRSFKLPEPKK